MHRLIRFSILDQSYSIKDARSSAFTQGNDEVPPPLVSHNVSKENHRHPFVRLTLLVVAGITACSIAPTPLTLRELAKTLENDKKTVLESQEPVKHPIDLYEAMARALKYNLDYRVQLLEKMVALTEMDISNLALLPKLAANAGFTSRNPIEASSGYSLTTQKPSGAYSTSSDLDKSTADLNMVWNILDFGVSYFQAKQTADRFLMAEENRRKLVHTQLQEVQSAFWHAVSSQALQGEIKPILQQANQALEDAYIVEKEGLRPQLEMMRYQRALLDIVRQLEALREELELAKKNLAKLINLPPSLPFQLKVPDREAFQVIPIQITTEEMEQLALQNRPEMRQAMYDTRISAAETRKALLRLLPGLEFKTAYHYDSNSFALNSTWGTAGLQVTSNLMNLVSGPATLRLVKNKEALSQMRRLAMSMAIFSQVHIAFRKYSDSKRKFETVKKISDIDQRVLQNISVGADLKAQSRLDHIQAATRSIMSRLQHNQAFAETQNALGLMSVSLGVDFLPRAKTNNTPLTTLSQTLRKAVEAWNDGISSAPRERTSSMEKLLTQAFLQEGETAGKIDPSFFDFFFDVDFDVDFTLENQRTLPPYSLDDCRKQAITWETWSNCKEASPRIDPPQETKDALLFQETENTLLFQETEDTFLFSEVQEAPSNETKPREAQQPKPDEHPPSQQQIETPDLAQQPTLPDPEQTLPPDLAQQTTLVEEVRALVKAWAKAWSRHRVEPFLAFYSPSFRPAGNRTREQWMRSYENFLSTSTAIKIALTDLAVALETDNRAKAFVHLMFETKEKKEQKQKTLTLSKEKKGWRIIEERSGIQFGSIPQDTLHTVRKHAPTPEKSARKNLGNEVKPSGPTTPTKGGA